MIPPISGPNNTPFEHSSLPNSIETIRQKFEQKVDLLQREIGSTKIYTRAHLSQINSAVCTILKCSEDIEDIEKKGGDSQTIEKVKQCIQDTLKILSTPDVSILKAVKEDNQANPPSTTHLEKTLQTFQKFPLASARLVEELKLIAEDVHKIHPPHRSMGA